MHPDLGRIRHLLDTNDEMHSGLRAKTSKSPTHTPCHSAPGPNTAAKSADFVSLARRAAACDATLSGTRHDVVVSRRRKGRDLVEADKRAFWGNRPRGIVILEDAKDPLGERRRRFEIGIGAAQLR